MKPLPNKYSYIDPNPIILNEHTATLAAEHGVDIFWLLKDDGDGLPTECYGFIWEGEWRIAFTVVTFEGLLVSCLLGVDDAEDEDEDEESPLALAAA